MAVNRALVAFLVFFVAVAVALSAIIIWRESLQGFTTKDRVMNKYRPFFRTAAEQSEFVRIADTVEKDVPIFVNTTVTNGTSRCYIACNSYSSGNTSQFNPRQCTYLSCFSTRLRLFLLLTERSVQSDLSDSMAAANRIPRFQHRPVLPDIFGQNVNVVQYPDLMQFIMTEHCEHVAGCSGCTCSQTYNFITVVVKGDDDDDELTYKVAIVLVPGCCKCINI